MKNPRLIINADDFGYSSTINNAIVKSFELGLCSSTTIMSNMPGFEEACRLAREYNLTGHIGLHFVLTEGSPLTRKILKIRRFCDQEGKFCYRRNERVFKLDPSEKDALVDEIFAQIDRCRQKGLSLTHIDSHHHVHTEWAIMQAIIHACRHKGIPYIRLSRNSSPRTSFAKKIYKFLFNTGLKFSGVAGTRYFGSAEDYLHIQHLSGSRKKTPSFEVMIHPTYDSKMALIDNVLKKPLEQLITQIEEYRNAVSYDMLY